MALAAKDTAVRVVREQFGADISKCTIHRFLDFKYTTEEGAEIQTTIMIPEIWKHADLPLVLGKLSKEDEEEVKVLKTVEEPMTSEDIEAQKKGWREKIEKMRAQAKAPRPGEREVERMERLERMEEEIQKLERNPPDIKETKQVTKEVVEKKLVRREISKPVLVSLQNMLDLAQPYGEGPHTNALFEVKMFAHCFLEMVKLEMGLKIIDWLPSYKARVTEENELHSHKRKRDTEAIQEREKINRERQAKRQKLEAQKKPKVQAPMREADRLEAEQIELEKKKSGAEEEEEEEVEADLPPLKLTKLVYELDEAACYPFTFFDPSPQLQGTIDRGQLLQVFHRSGTRCHREIEELAQMAAIRPPSAANVPESIFPYRSACSIQKEVEEAEKKDETPAEGQPTEEAAEEAAAEA
eukprot:EG_transcript_3909